MNRAVARCLLLCSLALLASCATRHRGFYAEDGAPERVPSGILSTPDAVPRSEPLNPYANRTYAALGRTYTPNTSDRPMHQRGLASWYGTQFHGNRTASGERYDMFAMTAAHPTLPIPSYARVTNVSNGRSVIVRINDRGPFIRDRIIDLSYAAAAKLGLAGSGSGEVEVDRITSREIAQGLREPPTAGAGAPVRATLPPLPLPSTPLAPDSASAGAHWSVQLGAFAVAANADALRDRIALLLGAPDAPDLPPESRAPRVERDSGISRVLIGSLADRATAQRWAQALAKYLARETALYVR
ncbi:MAG TPA: septal ring lytic transglycosylase RlpA family protein [Burkholderiaceae bacterium]